MRKSVPIAASSSGRPPLIPRKLDGMGKWLVTAMLLGLVVATLWVCYDLWIAVVATVPAYVWVLLAIGGVLCIVLGGGLMALVFYSNRMGYDEPPRLVQPSDRSPTT